MTSTKDSTRSTMYAFCNVSVAPVRREPTHRAEQTSQLLFGERVEVLELNEETDWTRVRCAWDGYEGWCKWGQLQKLSQKEFRKETSIISQNNSGLLKQGHST